MRISRLQYQSVIGGVSRFDADHLLPLVRGHVGHAGGFCDPWIPDDGAMRTGFGDEDLALPGGVANGAGGFGIEMDLIGFLRDSNRLVVLLFFEEIIGLIDVSCVFEAGYGNIRDV